MPTVEVMTTAEPAAALTASIFASYLFGCSG